MSDILKDEQIAKIKARQAQYRVIELRDAIPLLRSHDDQARQLRLAYDFEALARGHFKEALAEDPENLPDDLGELLQSLQSFTQARREE